MLIKQRNKLFDLKVPRSLKLAYVWGKGLGLFANKTFKKGETVIKFKADFLPCSNASPEAVQVSETHCLDTKWLVPEAFINHSCSPSTTLDAEGYRYVAIKDISKNEEITFNYVTTEWDAGSEVFECHCGSKNCYKLVQGLKYLPKKEQDRLRPLLLPYLVRKLDRIKK